MTGATRKLVGATLPWAFVGSLALAALAVTVTPYRSGNPRAPHTPDEIAVERERMAATNDDRARRNELADEVKAGRMSFEEAACYDRHGEWEVGHCETTSAPPTWLSRN